MNRLEKILVATDLSPAARSALAQGVRLATRSGASLHVVHVVRNEYAAELSHLMPEGAPVLNAHLRDDATEKLNAELRAVDGPSDARLFVEIGSPIREIISCVKRTSADLLIVGTVGLSGGPRLGTVAVRCVRKAPTKVLVVPAGAETSFGRIAACVDFSPLSPVVVEQAARVANIDGGSVSVVHVYDMLWERSRWGAPSYLADKLETEFRTLMERRYREQLAVNIEGVDATFELIKWPDYGGGIVRHAREKEIDLVVTGTTGRSALAYMLLGTTAEKTMREVGCSVLAVKPPVLATATASDAEGSSD